MLYIKENILLYHITSNCKTFLFQQVGKKTSNMGCTPQNDNRQEERERGGAVEGDREAGVGSTTRSIGSINKEGVTSNGSSNKKRFTKVHNLSFSTNSDSRGKELLALLNGMEAEEDGKRVADKMARFIEIGELLGYDMNGCKETREHLITRIEDMEVVQ